MIRSFGIESSDTEDDAGPWPAFSLVPRAMSRTLPEALVILGLSALGVSGCAIALEPRRETRVVEDTVAAVEPAPPAEKVSAPPPRTPAPARSARLLIPVKGVAAAALRDNFDDKRGKRIHRALDIMAARGTPVLAAGDGRIAKVYTHALGGLCVYQYDANGEHAYYYAHLDAFAEGLKEGMELRRGDPIGFVGTTGNASPTAPHLHFAIIRLDADRKWYKGVPVNPFPYLVD